ncbi:hypothetical protein SAMN05421676_11224 [Salinibacillus kushneri]|uniref:Uncharacterized protein n=1 Tax=Salinibacillus kushneri TaxID=237682 RepID=A0A1I0IDW1_9BACI|nr:hypothetical protein [Salinibacillus kushneri]SET94965.1 hypothetical protein SAMN05421676_11224 [Salinibacillus kushneri]
MTLLIGYRGEFLTILMSDDRVTYHGDKVHFEDGNNKLIELPNMGWSVASGLTDFIDAYKLKLAKSDIRSVEDIVNSFSSSIKTAISEKPFLKSDIDNSEILATWFGTERDINTLAFHMGLLNKHKVNDNGMAVLQRNNIYIGFPYGFNHDKIEEYRRKYATFKDELNLSKILNFLLQAFYEISSQSDYANTHCDIGIHMFDSDGIYKIRISGESKDLLRSDDITKHYEIVDIIKADSDLH